MKPGDTLTCASCSASARVWTTGAKHLDGWPVLVTWQTPEGERTMVEPTTPNAAPPKCRACGAEAPLTATEVLAGQEQLRARAAEVLEPAIAALQEDLIAPAADDALARFEALAESFRRETGMLAPGKDQPAAMGGFPTEQDRELRWRMWCAARAAAAAPKRPPPSKKGQLSLL